MFSSKQKTEKRKKEKKTII